MSKDNSDEMFARKVLRPFAGLTYDDIMNEVRAIDKICKQITDHIVTVLRHGWLDSSFYYFDMELCEFNLEQYISGSNGGLMVFDDIMTWDILKQITLGLNYIHEQGLVHRDLKPRNVLYSSGFKKWKITDFGLSLDGTSKRLHTTRYARGTASYRAPELLNDAKYNNKADIWALGCILYELATRKQAFYGDHNVLQYTLAQGAAPLAMPIFPDNYITGAYRCIVPEMISAMLNPEFNKRPSTRDILEAVKDSVQKEQSSDQNARGLADRLVWISNCTHWTQEGPYPDRDDFSAITNNVIKLGVDSPLWKYVRWQRQCTACFDKSDEVPFIFPHPSEACMSAHPEAVKWLYIISDNGHECLLQRPIGVGKQVIQANQVSDAQFQPHRLIGPPTGTDAKSFATEDDVIEISLGPISSFVQKPSTSDPDCDSCSTDDLKSPSPFTALSPHFLQMVHAQFLIPLSTTRLLALSSSLRKSYVKAAKHSLATMLPSHITVLPSGRERGQYLAIDLGEMNMSIALVWLQDNDAKVDKVEKWTIPEPVKIGTVEEFFDWMAQRIVNFAEKSRLDQGEHEWKLGVTWSFPFAQNAVNKGTILQMGKGFKIDSIVNASLTNLLQNALESLRPRYPVRITALLDDASAIFLSHAFFRPITRMSLICGTGTNAACLCPIQYLSEAKYHHDEGVGADPWDEFVLVNTEWSMFGEGYLPVTKYDRIVDEQSGMPGLQPFETMVGGRYMGEIVRLVCLDGVEECAWSFMRVPGSWMQKWAIQTGDCSKAESYGFNYKKTIAFLNEKFPLHTGSYTTSDADLFKRICVAVSTRSASLIAASTVGLLQVNNELAKYHINSWTCNINFSSRTRSQSDSGLSTMDEDFPRSQGGSVISVQGSRPGSRTSQRISFAHLHDANTIITDTIITELYRGENGKSSVTALREDIIGMEEPEEVDMDDTDEDEVVVAFCGSVMEKYHNFRMRCQTVLDELVNSHSRPSSSSSDDWIGNGKFSVDTRSILEQRRVILEENRNGGILGAGILAAMMDRVGSG